MTSMAQMVDAQPPCSNGSADEAIAAEMASTSSMTDGIHASHGAVLIVVCIRSRRAGCLEGPRHKARARLRQAPRARHV